MTQETKTALADYCAAIDAAVGALITQRPAGSETVREYAARHGVAPRTAQERLAKAAASGKLEVTRVLIHGKWENCYTPTGVTHGKVSRNKLR